MNVCVVVLRRVRLTHVPVALLLVALAPIFGISFIYVATRGNPVPEKLAREKANTEKNIVADVTELYPVKVLGISVPHTLEDIVVAVKENDHVSIGGGRNSMGGQTASARAVQIDMREYNKILNISTSTKEITVQAGIRWRDIQDAIDPHGLAVKIMQTYSNFTVGGSLSVNVHGRYIGLGPVIMSVNQFTIVLADGSVVTASPTKHPDIFYSAIGGMGGIGVISDVTLSLADNINVERSRESVDTGNYWEFFSKNIRSNPEVIFHNGDMYPPDFTHISAVSWTKTDKEPTTANRLIPREEDYWKERIAWVVMSEWPKGRWIREHMIDPLVYAGQSPVHTRNYEASYDYAELEPKDRSASSYVLQEYFVPVERFAEWVPKMKKVFDDGKVNVINVSIRHAFSDTGAKLAWAPRESFAFVVYYKQGSDAVSRAEVGKWTRKMIDQVLSVGGTYYLPYQPLATDDQLHRAYPHATDYFAIKKQYDPTDKFTNMLWDKYYSDEKLVYYKQKEVERMVASTTKEYYRPFDNAHLAIPEWYIVYSADEYAAVLRDSLPSQYTYSLANKEYWREYTTVLGLTEGSDHDNTDYLTVLSVIGWSFGAENAIKALYENTIGRVSEWIAGNTQVAEDRYAAKVAKDYADFIYDYPWYDFPYFSAFKGLWSLDVTGSDTWRQDIRRAERKIFLSLEYGIKSIYSSLIAIATHAKFGVQDDIIYAVVTYDGGKTHELLRAPHYQPFTRLLRDELAKESANVGFRVVDIAGNDKITFAYRDQVGASLPEHAKEILRDPEVVKIVAGAPEYLDRITAEVGVTDITSVYRTLQAKQIAIDHFYDY